MNTTEFLTIAAEIVPDRPATVFEGWRTTYGVMRARVDRLANALAALGVGAGDRVGILQVNSDEYVEAYFAAAKLDAVYVPLNFRARAGELVQMVNEAGARVLLVGPAYTDLVSSVAAKLSSVEHYIALEEPVAGWHYYRDLIESASAEERYPQGDGKDLTLILFTAGTTGSPKGVMLSHDSFSSFILSNVTPADPDVEERNILSVPLYHVAGMQSVVAGVYAGRTLVVERQFEPGQWLELVEQERVTRAMMVPTMLKMVLDHPDFDRHDLSSLEVITYGAASMPVEVIMRAIEALPGVQFINAFGQTETAATITMLSPEDHVLEGSKEDIDRKLRRLSSIGKPLEDVEVRIVDQNGRAVRMGQVGELVARGDRLMNGYWHMPEATAEAIVDGWLHTGDLGYADEDGYIFLAGRARDFIKRGGEMVSPEEVERVLQSHPDIEEAAVIGVPDVDWGERVRAVVVAVEGRTIKPDEVIEFCRQRLASFKKPESIVVTDELPRSHLGKVLKTELRERFGKPTEVVGQ